jgi:hypothetical protein
MFLWNDTPTLIENWALPWYPGVKNAVLNNGLTYAADSLLGTEQTFAIDLRK